MTAQVNPYFNEFKVSTEQDLLNDLNREVIQIHGMALKYLPRDLTVQNDVLGEVTQSTFDDAYGLEFYLDTVDTFDGEDLLNSFGIDLKTSFAFEVHKNRFEEEVTANEPNILRPREGDLIYVPMSSSIYEITTVKKWETYFQLQKRYVWKIVAELYTYDGDTFNTGDDSIDDIADSVSDGTHQTNANDSGDPSIEDQIVADDWVDSTETNPFGDIFD